jgi:NADPH-dependent glutamate synthase beta subunit-like oxidoreductase
MQPKRTIESLSELPTMPSTIGTMVWNQTGEWRYLTPVVTNKSAPCSNACPAGEDTARIEMLIAQGLFKDAWEMILQENPFPGICGRVCFRPCEAACNRREFDDSIAIHTLERFAADMAERHDLKPHLERLPARPERIAIVGAGPSGLAAAWFMARLGYGCDLFESRAEAGGILRWGIPRYRLPLSVLQREVAQIETLGPVIHTEKAIDAKALGEFFKSYQGVYFACGHGKTVALHVPGETLPAVHDGLFFLSKLRDGQQPDVPGLSAVIGGGNTAIDVARSIVRLGGKALILYRRRLQDMPAFGDEVQMALDEGVELMELVAPASIERTGDGCRVVLRRMRVVGDDGGRSCVEPDGSLTCEVEVARLFKATGAEASEQWMVPPGLDSGLGILDLGSCSLVQKDGMTPLVYGGDVTNDVKSVVHAVASGKQAAMALDTLFREGADAVRPKLESCRVGDGVSLSMETYMGSGPCSRQNRHVVRYGEINTDYFPYADRMTKPRLERDERIRTFDEVDLQVSVDAATGEAKRCFNCGVCNQCDNCHLFCPDVSVIHDRVSGSRHINHDYCKGCGICSHECPRGVITMEDMGV